MKTALFALALPLLLVQDDDAKRTARIDQAVGWLTNEDADVREMGRKSIQEIGRDAIPAIERKIAEKGAADLVLALRRLDKAPGVEESWVSEKELRDLDSDEQFKREAERLPKDAVDKVMRVKYQEAMAHVRHKNYQKAFEMANGLIALDPRSTHFDD